MIQDIMNDKDVIKEREDFIVEILQQQPMSISDIQRATEYPRSFIRTYLSKLEGAEKVVVRMVGKAKLYTWNGVRSNSQ